MAEPIPHADDAAAYVLGTLGARDRRRFEARLKESPELRKVVRLLEAGSIGLAMAAPHREPPIRLWAGIQTAVTHECEKRGRSARRKWLRNVAGIAACAVVGWFAYTNWNHRPSSASPTIVSDAVETQITNAAAPVLARATSQASNLVSQPPRERRALRPGENATLRERVGDLENQVAHLAQTVTQQQAAPPDLNRLTFVNIVPEGSDGMASAQMAAPSPELQRALLLGVARQLGWMPPTPAPSPPPFTQPANLNPPAPQNDVGVDFVDLPPPPPVETPSPETQTALVEKPEPPPPAATAETPVAATPSEGSSPPRAIPAFVSGTNLVFAFDPPAGTETARFYSGNAGGPALFYGTITLGNNPTVVTMPIAQVRAWDNHSTWNSIQPRGEPAGAGGAAAAVALQPGQARILFNSASEGSVVTFRFTLPDPPSSSP